MTKNRRAFWVAIFQPIEEIIKVNNADEDSVHAELTEYVAIGRIKTEYERLFAAMAAAPKSPNEGVGVSDLRLLRSGKSSFAKNLGYEPPPIGCPERAGQRPVSEAG